MDTLLSCPRCAAFVQPDWPTCKICGFDPQFNGEYPSIYPPTMKAERPGVLQYLGAFVTLTMLVAGAYFVGSSIYRRYEHRETDKVRQEIVTIQR